MTVPLEKNIIGLALIRLAAGAAALAAGLAWAGRGGLAALFLGYLLLGGDILWRAAKNIARGRVFDENFLMSIATLGAIAIGEYAEAVGVMLFYQTGEFFQETAVQKTKKSITGLMDLRPDFANLQKDGRRVAPESVPIGGIIVVKPGEKIPIDGVVIEGRARLDLAALTGESVPRLAREGDAVLSGSLNQDGVLTIRTTRTFGESTAAKILALVESAASRKAPAENFISAFARYYTPAVVALAALTAALPPLLFGGLWTDWLHRALIFLVISCPCALVISVPLTFFCGLGAASRQGVLIKGGNYLDALADLDIAAFDKTGTLTQGLFKVTALRPAAGFTAEGLLELAARAEAFSSHPIALSIARARGGEADRSGLLDYREIAGRGVSVRAGGRLIAAGNRSLMAELGIALEETPETGTKVHVAADGVFAGLIVIADEIKPDSREAVSALKAQGVRGLVMLTGDDPGIAGAVARELGIDEVYGGLLPGGKVEKLEELRQRAKGKLAFVGDGINDAPALALADIGVAMGALGSDAALEAADVVLMTDEPSKLAAAVETARRVRRLVRQNIAFAVGVKAAFLLLGSLGAVSLWEAVFADVGVAALAALNARRAMGAPPRL